MGAPLRELHRVLRPGGQLVMATHHPMADGSRVGGSYFDVAPVEEVWREDWELGLRSPDRWSAPEAAAPLYSQEGPAMARLLVKLRPNRALAALERRGALRPLFAERTPFALTPEAEWFVAEQPGDAPVAWDRAHARVAEELGLAPDDVLFVEPDLVHDLYGPEHADPNEAKESGGLALAAACAEDPEDGSCGKVVGGSFAWHLDRGGLRSAREQPFGEPRTRIAHLDTGYAPHHATTPEHVLHALSENFVPGEPRGSGADPGRRTWILDASGHGTGTLGILAGRDHPTLGAFSGAPGAEVLPLRIAPRVVLLYTSAFAEALQYAIDHHCDVLSMSMGGLPSRLWREVVDRAYLGGMCLVTAAGNNFGGFPTRHVVYPARYGRVIAVAGVMADDTPYANLGGGLACLSVFEGNRGPDRVMDTALAAYTPNVPWARFGCPDAVRLDGEGTSAATPQVAAAAALWLEKHKHGLPRDWRRVEMVRHALFSTAAAPPGAPREFVGRGVLRAAAALAVQPRSDVEVTASDPDSFPLFRVLTGLGIDADPVRVGMFDLELMQRWLLNPAIAEFVPDPEAPAALDRPRLVRVMEAVIEDEGASAALRRRIADLYPVVAGPGRPLPTARGIVPVDEPAFGAGPTIQDPPFRRLRVYALDPSFAVRLATASVNEATLRVRWEPLAPGPVGAYLAVDDRDASGRRYGGADLEDPRLLATDGWSPNEANPHFHQQMAYAVGMATIEHFERALGRPVLWRPKREGRRRPRFTPRLTIRPHALRRANAYYSPDEVALLFGYFEASADQPGEQVPGSRIFTALSYDIVAHEMTHALLDGMHHHYLEPTNPDVLAFHEGFADLVALLQRFTLRDLLRQEIARARGDLEAETVLGKLAVQFGRGSGRGGALRSAIGQFADGAWVRRRPDPQALATLTTPHERGAVLLAAVFDAFLAIYRRRTADLLRIATGGTGRLPEGAIHPDLAARLADEASKAADHVLRMCIRALDYLPPVDVTFFEFLRALVTADVETVPDDAHGYRMAFVEAFRRHGIHPTGSAARSGLATMTPDALRWRGLDELEDALSLERDLMPLMTILRGFASDGRHVDDRETLFGRAETASRKLQPVVSDLLRTSPAVAAAFGLEAGRRVRVDGLRRAVRVTPDGRHLPQVVLALTQATSARAVPPSRAGAPRLRFMGGTTLVVDMADEAVAYSIRKSIGSASRLERTRAYAASDAARAMRELLREGGERELIEALHAVSGA